jgi:hypothetical protein
MVALEDGYQGPVLVVALRSTDGAAYAAGLRAIEQRRHGGAPVPALKDLPQDCVVAVAWVVDDDLHDDALRALGLQEREVPDVRAYVLAPDVGVFRRPVQLPQTNTEAA